ncbi:MAG: hypothetical protein U0R19_26180 [Bryobacteraceae bacterium]
MKLFQAVIVLVVMASQMRAATVTFSNLISGVTSYGFDGDGDTVADVVFSTTDPLGFNTSGPGPFQLYVFQQGLEGTSLLNPDLRVDFLHGATGSIQFGFAVNAMVAGPAVFATLELFDALNNSMGSATVFGARFPIPPIQSTFTEGQLTLPFSGTAAYGLFNFSSSSSTGRYFLDNFTGTFGSTENTPEPCSIGLVLIGVTVIAQLGRKRS